ncbi:class I SAM-dependent methyltransferase [Bacillus carboniphilus]|uniref:Class I SAM-dependent methyltransferase n=1 Tax=Bacillus carboniphilus TaxID=86663 RepID=A0ABY9JPD4_9BACI|nr:class I SAM-dependent methyltransferase [Bacillus carboniphilus]WLR41172.1 class I SAM-dependent methyltransferase [Bacillus carboniphilus]
MKMLRILPFAKQLLQIIVLKGDIVIDGTLGNGHDTLFLAKLVGVTGHVYGFDIQETALTNTKERLVSHNAYSQVSLFHSSHDQLSDHLPESCKEKVSAAIFNLGYLPGGDKSIVTKPESTISAIEQLIPMLKPEGIIVLVIYHGHPEGKLERDELLNYVSTIDQQKAHVLKYQFVNQQNNAPFVIAIEKR